MYKFRTLVRDTEQKLNGKLVGSRTDLITPTGKFLRDTRLDELPQFWNVLRREMDIAGPRPVRPEVYENLCKGIPRYDQRFKVHPGIIGLSQVFTPHSTPKVIRAKIDNILIMKQEKVWWNFCVLGLTAIYMTASIMRHLFSAFYQKMIRQMILRRYKGERRKEQRVETKQAQAYPLSDDPQGGERFLGNIVDINGEALLLQSDAVLNEDFSGPLKLYVKVDRVARHGKKAKRASCEATLYRSTNVRDNQWQYVLTYKPVTPFNAYLVHQYFLHESVA